MARRPALPTSGHESSPDVVFIDLDIPIRRGIELVQLIGETCPDATIVARVHLRTGNTASFRLEVRDGALRLSRDDAPDADLVA